MTHKTEGPGLVRTWREPWMDDGNCANVDPELWFPDKGGSVKGVKAICRSCDVIEECLQYALRNRERYGVWGGKSEMERRKLLRSANQEESNAA